MSHLMDYGPDWPPRPPRPARRRSVWRWLNAPKRRERAAFDRNFWFNVAVILTAFVAVTAGLKVSDQFQQTGLRFTPRPPATSPAHH